MNQTGATWTEDVAGHLRLIKTGNGRAALGNIATGDSSDVEVLVKIRSSAKADGPTPVGVVVRGSGAAAAENGYYFALGNPRFGPIFFHAVIHC